MGVLLPSPTPSSPGVSQGPCLLHPGLIMEPGTRHVWGAGGLGACCAQEVQGDGPKGVSGLEGDFRRIQRSKNETSCQASLGPGILVTPTVESAQLGGARAAGTPGSCSWSCLQLSRLPRVPSQTGTWSCHAWGPDMEGSVCPQPPQGWGALARLQLVRGPLFSSHPKCRVCGFFASLFLRSQLRR